MIVLVKLTFNSFKLLRYLQHPKRKNQKRIVHSQLCNIELVDMHALQKESEDLSKSSFDYKRIY